MVFFQILFLFRRKRSIFFLWKHRFWVMRCFSHHRSVSNHGFTGRWCYCSLSFLTSQGIQIRDRLSSLHECLVSYFQQSQRKPAMLTKTTFNLLKIFIQITHASSVVEVSKCILENNSNSKFFIFIHVKTKKFKWPC